MSENLIIILCVLAVFRQRTAALSFALFTIAHDQLFGSVVGWGYYLSAGVLDVMSLSVISTLAEFCRMTTSFVFVCMASLFLNFFGWGLWLGYYPPISYDISFYVLYSVAILITIKGDSTRDEGCNYSGVFPFVRDKGSLVNRSLSEEARD